MHASTASCGTEKTVKKTKLTSKQYYCNSGITKHKKQIQGWMSDNFNEEDFERDTKEENRMKKCPIGGAFLDRDGNAAANIVQKLFLLTSSGGGADQTSTASLVNLTRGVQVQQKRVLWLNSYVDDKKKLPHRAAGQRCAQHGLLKVAYNPWRLSTIKRTILVEFFYWFQRGQCITTPCTGTKVCVARPLRGRL